jgi:hypothetical protein
MSVKHTAETFWKRVATKGPDECWEWLGARTSSGYGSLSFRGVTTVAHRVAYALGVGGIQLPTGFRIVGKAARYRRFVLHRCDNRGCCNPNHLFLGSMSTNLKDAYSKKRKAQPKSSHVNAKLLPQQVIDIRRVYDAGEETQDRLARMYGVSQRVISLVVRRESYKDVL